MPQQQQLNAVESGEMEKWRGERWKLDAVDNDDDDDPTFQVVVVVATDSTSICWCCWFDTLAFCRCLSFVFQNIFAFVLNYQVCIFFGFVFIFLYKSSCHTALLRPSLAPLHPRAATGLAQTQTNNHTQIQSHTHTHSAHTLDILYHDTRRISTYLPHWQMSQHPDKQTAVSPSLSPSPFPCPSFPWPKHRLQTTVYRLPTTDYRLSSNHVCCLLSVLTVLLSVLNIWQFNLLLFLCGLHSNWNVGFWGFSNCYL